MTDMKIERLNLVLRTIRNVNQLLVKERDCANLLQGICDNLTENRGYYNVWIAHLDGSGQLIGAAESGLGNEFQPIVNLMKQGELTDCGKKAVSKSEAFLIEDPFTSCPDCPLAKKYEGRSGLAIGLRHNERIFGLLCVSIPKEFISDKDERDLLQEIAGDIAFGLHNIEAEESRIKTEKKLTKIQQALLESDKGLRDLVENSLTGISIIQGDKVSYRNPTQKILLAGLPHLFHHKDTGHIYPDDVDKVESYYQELLSNNIETESIDFRFYPLGKIGSKPDLKWVHCQARQVDFKGEKAILINLMDITTSKELEVLLSAQDKMASLGRVAAGIAHEIRNPLSGINIYLNALEKCYDSGDRDGNFKQIIEQLQSASRRIESVIKRVMDFSKTSEPSFVQVDINRSVKEAIDLSSVTLRKSGVAIEHLLADDLAHCNADPQLITQVLLNLITNAAEAMKNLERGKHIRVATYMDNEQVTISVSDSGPGVPLRIREKIFDPFYTTKDWSTGIGLSLCHRVISDHRGTIKVHEGELGGAEFRVSIPTEISEDSSK
ncbi:MAG: GAF domain-containing protein [Deltaproteobacteria bacterium]|nr:GAF domain-containing protein [Deltaproteobacteria bacterium]